MCLFWIGSVIKLNQQGKSICLLWINTYVLLQSVFPAAGGDVIQSQIQFPCLYNVETCDLVQCVTILCKMWIYGTIIEYISFSAQLIHSHWLKCFPGICWCKNNLDVADVSLCWTYCTVFKQTCITRTVEGDGLPVFSHIITETEKGKAPLKCVRSYPPTTNCYSSTSTVSSSASLWMLRTVPWMLDLFAGGSTGTEKGSVSAVFSWWLRSYRRSQLLVWAWWRRSNVSLV